MGRLPHPGLTSAHVQELEGDQDAGRGAEVDPGPHIGDVGPDLDLTTDTRGDLGRAAADDEAGEDTHVAEQDHLRRSLNCTG